MSLEEDFMIKKLRITFLLALALALTSLPSVQVNAEETAKTVSNYAELKAAVDTDTVTHITLAEDIELEKAIVSSKERYVLLITRPLTIDGAGHTLSAPHTVGWESDYIIQAFKTKGVVLKDIKLTGGDAGLLVNSSEVTLKGVVDVSGNEFGGIEVSHGENPSDYLNLTIEGTLVNSTEHENAPTIWVENAGKWDTVVKGNNNVQFADEDITAKNQTYLFLTTATVYNYEQLAAAVKNVNVEVITLANDIELEEVKGKFVLVVGRPVTIDGAGHTLTGPNRATWKSDYAIQVFKATDVIIKDIKLTGSDAALLVNSSEVTLEGVVDVSGNEFGGIEVSHGANPIDKLNLTINGTLKNTTESATTPTVWLEKNAGDWQTVVTVSENSNVKFVAQREVGTKEQTYLFFEPKVVSDTELIDALENLESGDYVVNIDTTSNTITVDSTSFNTTEGKVDFLVEIVNFFKNSGYKGIKLGTALPILLDDDKAVRDYIENYFNPKTTFLQKLFSVYADTSNNVELTVYATPDFSDDGTKFLVALNDTTPEAPVTKPGETPKENEKQPDTGIAGDIVTPLLTLFVGIALMITLRLKKRFN